MTSIDCEAEITDTTWDPNYNYSTTYSSTTGSTGLININDPDHCNYYGAFPIDICVLSLWDGSDTFSVKIVCDGDEPVQRIYYGNGDCSGNYEIGDYFESYYYSYNCAGSSTCPYATVMEEDCDDSSLTRRARVVRDTCLLYYDSYRMYECAENEYLQANVYDDENCNGEDYSDFELTIGDNCDEIGTIVTSITCDEGVIETTTSPTSEASSNTLFSVLLWLNVFWCFLFF
jgi:hypothetical protein